jgi:type VI secretion system protein ImpB
VFKWSPFKSGSQAPEGRLNLDYTVGRHTEQVPELPLRYLVVGNFTGDRALPPIAKRAPVKVSEDKIDQTIKALAPTVTLHKVRDRLREPSEAEKEPETPPVTLTFTCLADFHPDRILAQLTGGVRDPEQDEDAPGNRYAVQLQALAQKLEIRRELMRLRAPMGNRAEFRKAMEALIRDDRQRADLMRALGVAGDI